MEDEANKTPTKGKFMPAWARAGSATKKTFKMPTGSTNVPASPTANQGVGGTSASNSMNPKSRENDKGSFASRPSGMPTSNLASSQQHGRERAPIVQPPRGYSSVSQQQGRGNMSYRSNAASSLIKPGANGGSSGSINRAAQFKTSQNKLNYSFAAAAGTSKNLPAVSMGSTNLGAGSGTSAAGLHRGKPATAAPALESLSRSASNVSSSDLAEKWSALASPRNSMNGGKIRKYSREELISYYCESDVPTFDSHFPLELISTKCLSPSLLEEFDEEKVHAEWEKSIERKEASRWRNKQQYARNSGRRSPYQGGNYNRERGPSWRDELDAGRSLDRRNTGNQGDNWNESEGGSRDRHQERDKGESGAGRWGRLSAGRNRGREDLGWRRGPRSQPGDNNGRYNSSKGVASGGTGDPTADSLNARNRNNRDPSELQGMGLENMALAAQKFAMEMEVMRKDKNEMRKERSGDDSEVLESVKSTGFMDITAGNDLLDGPLEEGMDRPPEEEIINPEEAVDVGGMPLSSELESAKEGIGSLKFGEEPQMLQQLQQIGQSLKDVITDSENGNELSAGEGIHQQWNSGSRWGTSPSLQQPTWGMPSSSIHGQQDQQQELMMQQKRIQQERLQQERMQQERIQQEMLKQQQQERMQQERMQQERMKQQQMHQQEMMRRQQQLQQNFHSASPSQEDEWFYQDPQGNIQGPFESKEMRKWLDHGYFDMNLMVRRGRGNNPFIQLGRLFGNLGNAFSHAPPTLTPTRQNVPSQDQPQQNPQQMLMRMMQQQQNPQQQAPSQQGMFQQSPLGGSIRPNPTTWQQPQQQYQNPNFQQPQQNNMFHLQQQESQQMEQQRYMQQQQPQSPTAPIQQQVPIQRSEQQQYPEAAGDEDQGPGSSSTNPIEDTPSESHAFNGDEPLSGSHVQPSGNNGLEKSFSQKVEQEQLNAKETETYAQAESDKQVTEKTKKKKKSKKSAEAKSKSKETIKSNISQEESAHTGSAEPPAAAQPQKAAWGGASKSPASSKLSLQQIQQQEEAMRREQERHVPRIAGTETVSMAARIAKAAGISTGLPPTSVPDVQTVPLVTPPTVASAPVQNKATLADMSVDLKMMLGVGGGAPPSSASASAATGASAWGSGGTGSTKSLREIQEEESKREKQKLAKLRSQNQGMSGTGVPAATTGGWASKVAANTTPPMSSVSAAPTTASSTDDRLWNYAADETTQSGPPPSSGGAWTVARSRGSANQTAQRQPQQATSSAAASNAASGKKNDFGGKSMSPEFYQWCNNQISSLGAKMELLEFCYTIESAAEIRETLRDYLGSTPQVSSFATEFIQKKSVMKRGMSGKGNQANSAGFMPVSGSKKNRRKKDKGF